ncbi:MAG TPA: hypothetical protein VEB43_14625 [Anaeromyxobacter sp.]|nr:hypothetical protein [Anaeromyxobacter sp.]
MSVNLAVVAPAVFGLAWVVAVARRAPDGAFLSATRMVAGGAVAFAAAWSGYAVLDRYGLRISWEDLTAGGRGSVVVAAAIGFVEESAKLVGLALASVGARRGRGQVLRRILGVSAVFASLECAFTLGGGDATVILVRAAFAPIAHAALAIPLGLAISGGSLALRWALPALAVAVLLHGASDLALAIPSAGRLGHAVILSMPAVALHLRSRMIWAREARAA